MVMTTSAGQAAQQTDIRSHFRFRQLEIARRHAVDVLFFIYLIIVLEGLIRKYGLPDYQRPLILLRDPVVLYLYIHALRNGLVKRSALLVSGLILMVATILVVGIQLTTTNVPDFLMAFGFRMYYSLLLMPFIIATVFNHEDMQRFFRLNLILVTLMAPLLVLQVTSPKISWINTGGAFDEDLRFINLTYGTFIRPSGFFTSTGGAGPFLTLAGAIILSIALMPRRERPCSALMFMVATVSFMVSIAVCGNRGAIVGLLIVGISASLLRFILPLGHQGANRAIFGAAAYAVACFVVALVLFPDNFSALEERWSGANAYVGPFQIIYRALDGFIDFIGFLDRVPGQGIGIGAATNAATTYFVQSAYLFEAESGWSRHIVDLGPFLGIVFIGWRIWFTIHLFLSSLSIARSVGDPRPWLMFAAMGIIILYGQTSGNSTIAGLAWFGAGLILAAPNYARTLR